jgi:hypothetical protein
LNGNRKGSTVLRTVGDDHEPRAFATYSACVIALIGSLPDTLHDRSVAIDLKRRLAREAVEPFRPDRTSGLDVLARQAARWAHDHADKLADADPDMPTGVINRMADNWRPLLSIADVAGGDWPQRARKAVKQAQLAAGGSRLETLLHDIRTVLGERTEMPSADLVKGLVEMEGHPWAELGRSGKPLTQTRLARLLKSLGIAPGNIGPKEARVRGYARASFEEDFGRYLAIEGVSEVHNCTQCDETGTSEPFKVHTEQEGCAPPKREKPNIDGLVGGCAPSTGEAGDEGANGSQQPGLSEHRIREHAHWYEDRADEARKRGADLRDEGVLDELGAAVREVLRRECLPEFVEVEFERVMDAVFGGVGAA